MPDYATLQIRVATKRILEERKRPGESFDALVLRLLAGSAAAEEEAFLAEVHALLDDRDAMRPLR